MKLIIRQILIAFLLISITHFSQCDLQVEKGRLSNLMEQLPSIIREDYRTSDTNVDMDCVRNLFKLPENEKIILKPPEITILKVAALLKCWNNEKVFARYAHAIAHIYMKDYLDCMKWHLQKLEPDSILIDNFDSSHYEPGYCKNVFDFPYKGYLQKAEKEVGPIDVFTCKIVAGMDDFVRFSAKLTLVVYGEYDDGIMETEMKKLKKYFTEITLGTADCIIKRFESAPESLKQNENIL